MLRSRIASQRAAGSGQRASVSGQSAVVSGRWAVRGSWSPGPGPDAGGIKAGSRWLSEATPPDSARPHDCTPAGVPAWWHRLVSSGLVLAPQPPGRGRPAPMASLQDAFSGETSPVVSPAGRAQPPATVLDPSRDRAPRRPSASLPPPRPRRTGDGRSAAKCRQAVWGRHSCLPCPWIAKASSINHCQCFAQESPVSGQWSVVGGRWAAGRARNLEPGTRS